MRKWAGLQDYLMWWRSQAFPAYYSSSTSVYYWQWCPSHPLVMKVQDLPWWRPSHPPNVPHICLISLAFASLWWRSQAFPAYYSSSTSVYYWQWKLKSKREYRVGLETRVIISLTSHSLWTAFCQDQSRKCLTEYLPHACIVLQKARWTSLRPAVNCELFSC